MDRGTALQVLAEDVLSDRDSGSDRDLVSDFVKGMFNQDLRALQGTLDEPLIEAQVTHVTRRILGVLCDLVLSVVPTMLSQQEPRAQSRSVHLSKSVRFASPLNYDADFIEAASEETMCIITSICNKTQASLEQKDSEAEKVLQAMTTVFSRFKNLTKSDQTFSSALETESHFTYDPQEDCFTFFDRKFWVCTHKIKALFKTYKKSPSLTVCPQKVTTELSNEEFQRRCQDELMVFLQINYAKLSHDSEAEVSSKRRSAVASELLRTVINAVHELCEPDTARQIEVSDETLQDKTVDLKCNINIILMRFFSQTEFLSESDVTDELKTRLEDTEIISKSQLKLFAKLLLDKVQTKYFPQDMKEHLEQNPSLKAHSFPEVDKPEEGQTQILPSKRTRLFVAEAVIFLLKSLFFPSPTTESASSMSKASDDLDQEAEALEQLFTRLQNLQPELF